MRPRFVKAFHMFSAAILNKPGPVLVQAREFHSQHQAREKQLIKDVRSLGKQMTTASLRVVFNQIQDLHSCRRENGIWSLLDRLDLHSVLQADKEGLFGLLGRLSLESDAKKLILKLQTVDEDHKQNLSNFIHLYTMGLSKKAPLAFDVVCSMLEDGHTPDIDVLNRFLETCHYSCEFFLVKGVNTMIYARQIKPNAITIERMTCLFMKMDEPTEAKRLLREVRRFDIYPTTNTYNAILAGYFRKHVQGVDGTWESSIAQTMVEHISGDDIHEHVDRIRNACDKGV